MRTAITALLTAFFTAFSCNCLAFGFGGIELGANATPEMIREKLGLDCGKSFDDNYREICRGDAVLVDTRAAVRVFIGRSGSVQRISLTFDSGKFGDVAADLVARYGQPVSTENSIVHNRMGAAFDQVRQLWVDGDNRILLERYGATTRKSSLDFSAGADVQTIEGR